MGIVTIEEIKPALEYCTHLMYGFEEIDSGDFGIPPLERRAGFDEDLVRGLKRSHPNLKVFLSIGGNKDTDDVEKYLELVSVPLN